MDTVIPELIDVVVVPKDENKPKKSKFIKISSKTKLKHGKIRIF